MIDDYASGDLPRRPNEESDTNSPESRMWKAVLLTYIEDIRIMGRQLRLLYTALEAQKGEWEIKKLKDYIDRTQRAMDKILWLAREQRAEDACSMADVDYEYFYNRLSGLHARYSATRFGAI